MLVRAPEAPVCVPLGVEPGQVRQPNPGVALLANLHDVADEPMGSLIPQDEEHVAERLAMH